MSPDNSSVLWPETADFERPRVRRASGLDAATYATVAPEDAHFGVGETTDDGELTEVARRERAELWGRIANAFS